MLNFFANRENRVKAGCFFAGMIVAEAGGALFKSKCVHKLMVNATAAALRAKENALAGTERIQAAAEDIVAEAEEKNRREAEADETEIAEVSEVEEDDSTEAEQAVG